MPHREISWTEKICPICNQPFSHKTRLPRTYCGRNCAFVARRVNRSPESDRLTQGEYYDVQKYREGARYRGLAWEISDDQCLKLLAEPCYLCGQKGNIGIDRIDSSRGYTPGNVAPCCTDCNLLKGGWGLGAFFDQIKLIYEHSSAQGYYRWLEKNA